MLAISCSVKPAERGAASARRAPSRSPNFLLRRQRRRHRGVLVEVDRDVDRKHPRRDVTWRGRAPKQPAREEARAHELAPLRRRRPSDRDRGGPRAASADVIERSSSARRAGRHAIALEPSPRRAALHLWPPSPVTTTCACAGVRPSSSASARSTNVPEKQLDVGSSERRRPPEGPDRTLLG